VRVLAAAALVLAACATTSVSSPVVSSTALVAARYGTQVVTEAEVDARAHDELLELQQKMYEVRRQTAERLVVERLVEQAAAKAGQKPGEWMVANIEQIPGPTESDLRQAFEGVRRQLPPSVTFEEARPRIEESLVRRARVENAKRVFDNLKREAGLVVLLKRPPRLRKQVEAKGPSRGPADAKVTLVVFSDFQCPFCSKGLKTIDRVMASYPQVRMVYRHFPLSFHKQAQKAAEASMCAHEQQKFWPFHDVLYERQDELGLEDLKGHAIRVGLDARKFDECLESGRMKALVDSDREAGQAAGVDGTPATFVNGVMLSGARDEAEYKELIDEALAEP
jgi:protein-disulfide isomerase